MSVLESYQKYCTKRGFPFSYYSSVGPLDPTTLFCSAGMQRYKQWFSNINTKTTLANCQACLRTNDLELLGDGTHSAYFNMLGLFSFRDWTIKQAIDFWLGFIEELGLKLDYVTIHPDKYDEWEDYYPKALEKKRDSDCKWSDGAIGGYCTEFYINRVEIGNIVNPLGTCIDAGFGLERLEILVNKIKPLARWEELINAAKAISLAGYVPSNVKQGYILRKILRTLYKEEKNIPVRLQKFLPEYAGEKLRQQNLEAKYLKLKDKFPDKDSVWWFGTHGIDLD